jgi:hypothetical protein
MKAKPIISKSRTFHIPIDRRRFNPDANGNARRRLFALATFD